MNSKLYSVNELSEMFDISKQAIYKKKKTDPMLKPFWTTVNNVLHLDYRGLDILKSKISLNENELNDELNEVDQKDNQIDSKLNDVENNVNLDLLLSSYQDHINDLRDQLNSKDNQINNLNDTISTQSELLKNMQVLLKENKDQIKTLEAGKKSIFTKLFKKDST
jgi:chromosome segregation ATPase